MFTLKRIALDSVPRALEKAERYRLLNEPRLAESICQDIIAVDPNNQQAITMLLLSITDQIVLSAQNDARARTLLPRLEGAYEKAYYSGIIAERRGKSALDSSFPNARFLAYEYLRDAMEDYERALTIMPEYDDPVLRWNTCVRLIEANNLHALQENKQEPQLE